MTATGSVPPLGPAASWAAAIASWTALLAWLSSRSWSAPLPPSFSRSVLPMSTRVRGPPESFGMPEISWIDEPRPSMARVISDGMTHTLLALPSAILGIIWRYW